MQSFLRPLRRRHHQQRHLENRRTLVDVAAIKWVRDRGLDHAVEKERNLRPLLNLKNLLKSEPSKSLPLPIIAQNRDSLGITIRPAEFVRKYPCVFEEFLPGEIGIHSHVKLTPETLALDAEEQLIYQRESSKQDGADRLLKLLMLGKINKLPLHIIDRLKWDLGLPQDYTQSIVPYFPDYFRITGGNRSDSSLELVCWSTELAVSVMEKKAVSEKMGMPIAFPLQYSRGFEADKKFKKWVDLWQKLPYISPYENALHLPPTSDEADKWAVSVLHELLHLLVSKKMEREFVLCLGECLGLRPRFKRALLHHPGIFYLSSKIGMHTVVLREGYKRNLLVENHPLMDIRYKYIHLMHTVKEDKIARSCDSNGGEELQDQKTENVQNGGSNDLSDSETEEDSNDDDYNDVDEDEGKSQRFRHSNGGSDRVRTKKKLKFESTRLLRSANSLEGRYRNRTRNIEEPTEISRQRVIHGRRDTRGRSPGRLEFSRNRGRSNLETKASA